MPVASGTLLVGALALVVCAWRRGVKLRDKRVFEPQTEADRAMEYIANDPCQQGRVTFNFKWLRFTACTPCGFCIHDVTTKPD